MYNFLVTGREGAWDLPAYEYERPRFCEYTSADLKAKFGDLARDAMAALRACPSLFAYEGHEKDTRVGYLKRIKPRERSVLVELEFEPRIPPIPFAEIRRVANRLDIRIDDYEMGRTHWAIKDEDLLEVLRSEGLVRDDFSVSGGSPVRLNEARFKVALSFPGEKRVYVERVARELKKKLPPNSVFYDRDFTAQLARPNLDTLLQKMYLDNSDLVVVFLCSEYEEKEWCGLEWRAIRDIIKKKHQDSLMFLRFDGATISGTLSIDGYVDLRRYSSLQAAGLVLERVKLNEQGLKTARLPPRVETRGSRSLSMK